MSQDAVWQAQQLYLSPTSVEILGDARCGAAKDQIGAAHFRQGFSGLHGVVERLPLGFIIGVMITFIDRDHSQVGEGHKQGATRADYQFQVTAAGSAPGVVTFAVRELGVVKPNLVGKARHETPHGLGGHGNFGHHHQHLPALRQHFRGCPHVDFCFA